MADNEIYGAAIEAKSIVDMENEFRQLHNRKLVELINTMYAETQNQNHPTPIDEETKIRLRDFYSDMERADGYIKELNKDKNNCFHFIACFEIPDDDDNGDDDDDDDKFKFVSNKIIVKHLSKYNWYRFLIDINGSFDGYMHRSKIIEIYKLPNGEYVILTDPQIIVDPNILYRNREYYPINDRNEDRLYIISRTFDYDQLLKAIAGLKYLKWYDRWIYG